MKVNYLMFGGHPDDFVFCGGGTGLKFIDAGGRAKYISATNGDIGSPNMSGGEYARYRLDSVNKVVEQFHVQHEIWSDHDGEFEYSLAYRFKVLEEIREFESDIVVCPRIWDLHPDRSTIGKLVSEASYFATIPNILALVPALKKSPVVLYMYDKVTKPLSFQCDVAVSIDDKIDDIIAMADKHDSMVYEWDAFMMGTLDEVSRMTHEEKVRMA